MERMFSVNTYERVVIFCVGQVELGHYDWVVSLWGGQGGLWVLCIFLGCQSVLWAGPAAVCEFIHTFTTQKT